MRFINVIKISFHIFMMRDFSNVPVFICGIFFLVSGFSNFHVCLLHVWVKMHSKKKDGLCPCRACVVRETISSTSFMSFFTPHPDEVFFRTQRVMSFLRGEGVPILLFRQQSYILFYVLVIFVFSALSNCMACSLPFFLNGHQLYSNWIQIDTVFSSSFSSFNIWNVIYFHLSSDQ